MKVDNFINIPFTNDNLDLYYIRSSIFKSLQRALPQFKGELLDIGCGKMPYKKYVLENSNVQQYIGLDIESAIAYDDHVKPDFTWDGNVMPFNDNSFDTAFGTEVLEHCPEPFKILREVSRVLKPDGIFFGTVPFLWPLHETPHDEYRYTPFSLERHLKEAGFDQITIKATGGWHAAMAQMLGLWIKRSRMSPTKRRILSYVIKPVMRKLISLDKADKVRFNESQMITGLYFIAVNNE